MNHVPNDFGEDLLYGDAGQWHTALNRDLHEFAKPGIEDDCGMTDLVNVAEALLVAKANNYDFFLVMGGRARTILQ